MAVLCGMPTIQYSVRRARLSVLWLPKIQGLMSRDTIVDRQFVAAWVRV